MPADQIGFHTCWPRNSTTVVAVPRFGKLLLLPRRSGTDHSVPLTCLFPADGGMEKVFPIARGCISAENSKCFFKPVWWGEILPVGLPSKRRVSSTQEHILIDKRCTWTLFKGMEDLQNNPQRAWSGQETCTADGYTLAHSLKFVHRQSKTGT